MGFKKYKVMNFIRVIENIEGIECSVGKIY